MSLKLHPTEYTQWHSPIETVVEFLNGIVRELGLDNNNGKEIIMDVGCGPGGTTKEVILPFFHNVKKIIAVDVMPDMINIAQEKNAHPKIEYVVADITDWSTVEQWERKMSKVISIHCLHWVKDQRDAFENIHRLLKRGGEAVLFFVLEGTYFDVVQSLQKSSKWNHYLKDHDNRIPLSHHFQFDARHYEKLLEHIGFEVLHCKKEIKNDVYPSDESFKEFFSSLCVLAPFVPQDNKEEFKNDILQELITLNGRTDEGLPFHKGQILELIVKKR